MLLMSSLFFIVADINAAAFVTAVACIPAVNGTAADNIAAIVGAPFIPNVLSVAGLPGVVGLKGQ